MGCGVPLTSWLDGAAPVTPPAAFVGNTTCDLKRFHDWSWGLLGSTSLSDPYQRAWARPGPPALSHGKTLVASPVEVEPSLTWTGAVHRVHPLAALEALTKVWRKAGLLLLTVHTTSRLRPESIDRTEKRVSGEPVGVSAIWTSFVRSWPPAPLSSRKRSLPDGSGVPMFIQSPLDMHPLLVVQPAAWKTLPVTWSMAG